MLGNLYPLGEKRCPLGFPENILSEETEHEPSVFQRSATNDPTLGFPEKNHVITNSLYPIDGCSYTNETK